MLPKRPRQPRHVAPNRWDEAKPGSEDDVTLRAQLANRIGIVASCVRDQQYEHARRAVVTASKRMTPAQVEDLADVLGLIGLWAIEESCGLEVSDDDATRYEAFDRLRAVELSMRPTDGQWQCRMGGDGEELEP